MEVQRFAARALAVGGIMLLVVAAIHLAVTPMLRTLFISAAGHGPARFWLAPFLLNHVVVGILLVPVGLNTLYAARAAHTGAPWDSTTHIDVVGRPFRTPFHLAPQDSCR